MDESGKNRRKSKRYNVSWPARILLGNKKIVAARVRDVSSGGVGFEFDFQVPVGKEISIELSPCVNGAQVIIRAKGVVTYSMIKRANDGFSHGIKFTEIARDQFETLCGLLKRMK